MKKRFISFVSAIVVAFVAFAQVTEKAVQFTAVQDEASLVAGKRYIVVAEAEEGLVALSDQHNGTTPYRLQSNVLTESEGAIETVVATVAVEENLSVPYSLVLEGRAGEWKLYDEANEKYLHWTSKRSMELDDEGSVWTISINENGEAVIKLATEERTIRYGADDDRFACYTIGQTAVKLYEPAVQNAFFAAYANFMMLTETCSSMWMIPAVSEKFFALQEAGSAVNDSIWETPVEDIASLTETIVEATAYVQAMHDKYTEFKDVLFLCYDYQDNSTASDEVVAAFAEVVDLYAGYQWSVPATTVAELAVMVAELKNASFAYASEATPNDGFEFEDFVVYESVWVGSLPADGMATYFYNTSAKSFLAAGNDWGTRASFTATGVEWTLGGGNNVYTLDGQISNGGNSHYFGGEWTDAAATDFVFEMVGKNLFTLKVGDKYIAYDGSDIVANVTEINDGCYWQLVTKAERQGKYAEATEDSPVDATFEISGANFGRNDGHNSAWSGSPALGGANENFCAEKWNAGIVEVSQVLRGMPAGKYRLHAQGFYRMGSIEAAAAARTEGTEVLNAKFFANGDSVAIMSVMEECDKLAEGVDYPGFGKAPNSMTEASHYFSAGHYEHTIEFELAEGIDTIKLGATKTGSVDADWMIFDNFRLEFLGSFRVEVESPWVGTLPADGMATYIYNTSAKAFLAAGNSWGTQASFTETGVEWILGGSDNVYTLDGQISNGGDSHFFTGTYTDGAATDVVMKKVGDNLFTLKVGDNYIAYDGTSIVANVATLNDGCYWQFVTKAERQALYATATATAPADATFEISGANFGRNDGHNAAWSNSPKVGGDNENMNGEKWNAGVVEVSQVLRNMPNGVYRLNVQGFYRMGDVAPAAEARTAGTEVLYAKFFANGDSIPVMSVMEEAGKLDVGANYEGYGKAPNSQGDATKFFNAGHYEHSFMFTLTEGVDTIKLGVTKTGSVGNDWVVFDNFRLEFLGVANDVDFMGNGVITSISEGNHYVFYTDAEGKNHFLNAAGTNNWVVSDSPVTLEFSAGNTTEDPFASAASFMASNGFYMSNAANSDGSGAIKTETITGGNGSKKRTWESQVFYKNAAGKHAIRLTNSKGTSWGANCFVNIDPATLAVVSGQPSLGDALYLWEIADEDDPRFSLDVFGALIEKAEALEGACNKAVKDALATAIAAAKTATAAQVSEVKAALEAAIADVEASIADYKAIADEIAVCKLVLVEDAQGYDDFAEVVELAEILTEGGDATAETLVELKEAKVTYLAANEVADALVNGTFGDASAASVDGWTQVGGAMGKTGNHNKWTNVNDGFFEQWQNTLPDVEIYQEISGLPAGTYTFAAYVVACQQSNDDSHEVSGVNLFANSDSVAIHTINVDRNAANQAIGAELALVTTTIAEGETLKVGMSVKGTDANWVVIDNAKLYCFGKTSGIQTVELGEVADREFFNAAGVAVDAPVQGITIVKTTYTNGVVKVSKVFVK